MSSLTRVENWDSLLSQYLDDHLDKEFVWGVKDCCLFAADWVLLATGMDFAAPFRGLYDSEDGARLMLALYAQPNKTDIHQGAPEAYVDSVLPIIDLKLAGRGDIILHPDGAIGICLGYFSYFMLSKGIISLKTSQCAKAWKI